MGDIIDDLPPEELAMLVMELPTLHVTGMHVP